MRASKNEIPEKIRAHNPSKVLPIFKIGQFWQIPFKNENHKTDAECKLQYIPTMSFQTRTFDPLSFINNTGYFEKCRFTPGSDPMEL